jgi:hypothetical protein
MDIIDVPAQTANEAYVLAAAKRLADKASSIRNSTGRRAVGAGMILASHQPPAHFSIFEDDSLRDRFTHLEGMLRPQDISRCQ